MSEANDEMVEGYRDGRADTRLELTASLANRSASYLHGWANGRDDRVNRPRTTPALLRAEAEAAMASDMWSQ